jgi:hypothetical protein
MVSVEPLKFTHFDAFGSKKSGHHSQMISNRGEDAATLLNNFHGEEQESLSLSDYLEELCSALS